MSRAESLDRIFVDTGAWYAVMDKGDRRHREAARFYLTHAGQADLITSDLVLAETFTLLTAHLGRPAAIRFWETLRATRIPIVTAEPPDLEAAWRILEAFPDQDFSVTDRVSFAIMERQAIPDVFAFDSHFLVYRFGPKRRRAFKMHPA